MLQGAGILKSTDPERTFHNVPAGLVLPGGRWRPGNMTTRTVERHIVGAADHTAALVEHLRGFVEWAQEHRAQAKRAGDQRRIDAHRAARARRWLKRVGR